MPSAEHESPVALAKRDPELVAWTLTNLFKDIVLAALPPAARVRWEGFMTATVEEYRSELFREMAARNQQIGEALGEARGQGRAVLTVLAARGVAVPEEVREQVLACTDLAQLDTWLRRAGTATTVEQVLG